MIVTITIFLQAMVDVSTAYCNCDLAHIEEKIYEAPGNPRGMVELCQVAPSLLPPPTLPPVDGPRDPKQPGGDT